MKGLCEKYKRCYFNSKAKTKQRANKNTTKVTTFPSLPLPSPPLLSPLKNNFKVGMGDGSVIKNTYFAIMRIRAQSSEPM